MKKEDIKIISNMWEISSPNPDDSICYCCRVSVPGLVAMDEFIVYFDKNLTATGWDAIQSAADYYRLTYPFISSIKRPPYNWDSNYKIIQDRLYDFFKEWSVWNEE